MSVSILVVDDEPDVAELFRQQFRREVRQGVYVMHFAQSWEEALAKLDSGVQPHLVLSDINMPGMDGLGLLQRVKQRTPDLPFIMVTAYGDDERRRQAQDCGAAEFSRSPSIFCASGGNLRTWRTTPPDKPTPKRGIFLCSGAIWP